MLDITKEIWQKNGVEVTVLNSIKWLNEKDIEGLDHANLLVVTRNCPSKYRKHKHELLDELKKTT